MRVSDRVSGYEMDVFAIYWSSGKEYFYCFPKDSKGLSAYSYDEVIIVDPSIDDSFKFAVVHGGVSGIFHRKLLVDRLLDRLLEHDMDAYAEFTAQNGDAHYRP